MLVGVCNFWHFIFHFNNLNLFIFKLINSHVQEAIILCSSILGDVSSLKLSLCCPPTCVSFFKIFEKILHVLTKFRKQTACRFVLAVSEEPLTTKHLRVLDSMGEHKFRLLSDNLQEQNKLLNSGMSILGVVL